jgi:UDP-glucose 4-epimerase
MAELAAHVDGIIHLAACLGTQETIQNPRPAAETNVQGGLNFLEAIAQYDIPGVYIGVGNHWMNNTYSISKTTVERFAAMFNKERGTRCNIVRLVNAYGPYQSVAPPFGPAKVRKITPAFVCRALTGAHRDLRRRPAGLRHGPRHRRRQGPRQGAGEGRRRGRVRQGRRGRPAKTTTVNEVAELVSQAPPSARVRSPPRAPADAAR